MALLVAAGWWVLRAPAVVRGADAPAPDIDLDPPGMRARREAAIALVTMPDDPWSLAESLAPSAPEKSSEKERCGIEGGPQFSNPPGDGEMPVQTRAATAPYLSAEARVDAALRSSADPLDRAVADLLNIGDMRSPEGRDEAVVQQAAASTDARLYALGYGLCHSGRATPPSCARISAARWTQVDAGNGIPWLDVLAQAQAAEDAGGVSNAMSQLSASSRFDLYPSAMAGVVARQVPEDGVGLAADSGLATKALFMSLSLPSFQALIQVCRNHAGGDEPLEQQCRAISDSMFEHSNNLTSLSISGAVLAQMTGDTSRRDLVHAERVVLSEHWSPATGFSPCQELRDEIKFRLRSAQIGELEALRERARKFVTP